MKGYIRWHKIVGIAVLIAMLLAGLVVMPVMAVEISTGLTMDIPEGEVIDDDLFIVSGSVVLDGVVNGDLYAVGGSVTINGVVNGKVYAVGGTVIVNGEVAESIIVAGGLLSIGGDVGGSLTLVSRDLNITNSAAVEKGVLMYGGDVRIAGVINGDIKGAANDVTITGRVEGDINIDVDAITFMSTAQIKGNVDYTSENDADIRTGAQIDGESVRKEPEVVVAEVSRISKLFSFMGGPVAHFLSALVLGIVLIAAFHRRVAEITASIRHKPGASFGWGVVLLFTVPVAAVALGLTIVGLPLALILTVMYLIIAYCSQVIVGLVLGQILLKKPVYGEHRPAMIGALALGLAIIVALRSIPLLQLNIAIWIITTMLGLSAIVFAAKRPLIRKPDQEETIDR